MAISSPIRSALMLVLAASVVFSGCSEDSTEEREGTSTDLSVMFSSDLLGKIRSCGCTVEDSGGLGRRATYTKRMEGGGRDLVVLDCGDLFGMDMAFSVKEAEVAIQALDIIGVDVFTPGETDLIFGLPFLLNAAGNASFETILANMVDPGTGRPVFGAAWTVIELDTGLRLGVTGVLDDKILFPQYVDRSGFEVRPAAETLRRILPEMRERADFLVLMSHMGIERTRELLEGLQGFDLAVVGHGKPLTKKEERVGETLLVATGGLGQYLGRLDLTLSSAGEMEYARLKLVPLPEDIAIDPEIRELFESYELPLTDREAGRH